MANRLTCNISGTIGCQNLEGTAGGEGGWVHRQIAGADRAVGKPQEFDICECVCAVTAGNPVADNDIRSGKADDVIADTAGIYRRIYSISAVDDVAANA